VMSMSGDVPSFVCLRNFPFFLLSSHVPV
jgi:hypothetical protein